MIAWEIHISIICADDSHVDLTACSMNEMIASDREEISITGEHNNFNVRTTASLALQSKALLRAIASKTGRTSDCERLITFKTSVLGVCTL